MMKRIMLTLMFAAVFGAAGLSLADKADAQWQSGGPYASYYYGAPAYHYDYYATYPYRSYYAPQSYVYDPRTYYYAPEPSNYRTPDYYRPAPQVVLRNGWWR
jgi:hypothetical protein